MAFTPRVSGLSLFAATTTALSLASVPAVSHAQFAAPLLQPVAYTAYSSSNSGQNPFAGEDIDGRSPASAPNGERKIVSPQYGGGYGGGGYHPNNDNGGFSHLAIEAGGGFTAPIGNAASGGFTTIINSGNPNAIPGSKYPTITWGGNFFVGGGWNFTKKFGLLGEFSYNSSKIPGSTLSAFYNAEETASGGYFSSNGIGNFGGNVHSFGYTAEPIYYYYNSDKHTYAGYIIGGIGFYHRSINFTAPVQAQDFIGDQFTVNQTFSSYTDNSLGANFGTGVSFKAFGTYSPIKLFAEARYVFIDSPRESASDTNNGNTLHTGTEETIPVSVGIRF